MAKRPTNQAGSATVEVAVALPAVVVVLSVLLAVITIGVQRIQVERASAVGARLASISVPEAQIQQTVSRIAGENARVTIAYPRNGWVAVTVSKPVVGGWATLTLSASAAAPTEEHVIGFDIDEAT